MVTQLQPDVRAYLHGGEVIKRYIRVEEVAHEYGFSVEETEYIAKAAGSLYKLTRIHLVKKERFDEFMKPLAKVEELTEQNYNMIDNVLNNGAEKKEQEQTKGRISIKEKLAEKKAVIEQRDKAERTSPKKETEKKSQREM